MAARTLLLSCGALVFLSFPSSAHADRIVLRNLDVVDGPAVTAIDEDGVQLGDGELITWDRIERGRVGEPFQARFDQLLSELGADLYRIRQRLSVGDYAGVLPQAEALEERFADRRSDTAYLVFQALMWSRVAAGRREAAVAAYLRCWDLRHAAAQAGRTLELPGARRLQFDPETGVPPDLPPVWFDPVAAAEALPAVGRAIRAMVAPPPPAAQLYYATLALAAGMPEKAESARKGLAAYPPLAALVEAQALAAAGDAGRAAELLEPHLATLGPDLRCVALYLAGQARAADPDATHRRAGLLQLLTLPAAYGESSPDLAAAGLYVALHTLADQGDAKGSIALRRELLDRYGTTWHARQLRAEDSPRKEQP